MKTHKKNKQYLLMISIFFFLLSHCNWYESKNNIDKNKFFNNIKTKNNIKNSRNFYKYFQLLDVNKNLIKKNGTIYSLVPDYLFSEMQINNNSLNILNTYLKNKTQIIFNQIGLQLFNEEKIYTFGIGHRKSFHNKWTIGNNIFYDTTISQNNEKTLSIGHELFKNYIHVTINTYHNKSINNLVHNHHKKYIPYVYDIYIKYPIPFFSKIYGKINIEYCLNNKNYKDLISQNINNFTRNIPNISNKLIFGFIYIPISTFTFNINKTIYNSEKIYETKFNITAHYIMNIPWIYQTKYINQKKIYYEKKHLSVNKYSIIDRNNTIFSNYYFDNHNKHKISDFVQNTYENIQPENNITLKKHLSHKNKKEKKQKHSLTPKKNNEILELKKEHHNNQTLYFKNYKRKNKKNNSYNIHKNKKQFSKKEILSISNKTNVHSNIIFQDQILNDNTKNVFLAKEKEHDIIHNTKDNQEHPKKTNHHTKKQKLTNNTNNSKIHLNTKILKSDSKIKSNIKKEKLFNYENNSNIPIPPPISNYLKITNQHEKLQNNQKDYKISTSINNQNNIEKIEKHKQEKFSSIGSEEHLLKLNNIVKKRKKTLSTSSNDSNNSESSTTLLKIIERQSTLLMDIDTDSDEENSITSNNEFSE